MKTSSNNTNPIDIASSCSELNCSAFFHPLSISSRSKTHKDTKTHDKDGIFPIPNFMFCSFDSKELQTSSEIIYSTNKENGFDEYYKKQKKIINSLNQTVNLSGLSEFLTTEVSVIDKQSIIIHTALDEQRISFFENAVELYSKTEHSVTCSSINILDGSHQYLIQNDPLKREKHVKIFETDGSKSSQNILLQSENSRYYLQKENQNLIYEFKSLITKIKLYEKVQCKKLAYTTKIEKECIIKELLDLIEVYKNIDKLGFIAHLILNSSLNEWDIQTLLLMCDNFILNELMNYLSLKPYARIESLLHYSQRFKELQRLKQQFIFKKVFQFSLHGEKYLDWLPVFIKLPPDLKKSLNYKIQCYPINQDETYDKSFFSSIGNNYEKMDYSIITTNCFYFKLLDIFSMTSKIYKKVFEGKNQKQEINIFLHTYVIIIFKFLNISEILRSNELLIRIYSLFDDLIITSFELSSLELFINLTKEKCKAYKQRLNSISISCRSLSPLDKLNKNYWGKYSITHKCIQEFEIKCNKAILNKNKQSLKTQSTSNLLGSVSEISLISSQFFNLHEERDKTDSSDLDLCIEKSKMKSIKNKIDTSININKNGLAKNTSTKFLKRRHFSENVAQNNNRALAESTKGSFLSTSNSFHIEERKVSIEEYRNPTKKRSLFEIFNINPRVCKTKLKQLVFSKGNADSLVSYRSLVIMTRNIPKKAITGSLELKN